MHSIRYMHIILSDNCHELVPVSSLNHVFVRSDVYRLYIAHLVVHLYTDNNSTSHTQVVYLKTSATCFGSSCKLSSGCIVR
jgi:hypothetical protein